MNRKRRPSNMDFDEQEAFRRACDYTITQEVFVTPELTKFIEAKAKQHAVDKRMFLPSFLVGTASAMNMAKLRFDPNGAWIVPINLFALLVAPKGSGKTPASKVLLAPLSALEKEERRDYDEKRIKKKKKTVGKKRKIEEQEDDLDEEYDEVFDDEKDTDVEEKDTDVEEKGKKDEVEEHRKKAKIEENRQKDDEHSSLFHAKTRICETITSEALIETLRHNSGSLLLKTDEFKGWMDRLVAQANFESALCSAFTGEDIKYTTITRGEVTLCETAISVFGAVQPGPLADMLNGKPDHQGFFDRYLMIAAPEDNSVKFLDRLKPIPAQDMQDIGAYYRTIRDHHIEARMYSITQEALEEFAECITKLQLIEQESNWGDNTMGMTKKAQIQLQKVATVMACARETLAFIASNETIKFEVQKIDLVRAWEIVSMSIYTYKSFKVAIALEMNEKSDQENEDPDQNRVKDDITEDLLMEGRQKIKALYSKSNDKSEILTSVMKRDKLYLTRPGVGQEVFIQALVKFNVAVLSKKKASNGLTAGVLTLTRKTDDKQTVRLFKMLYQKFRATNIVFDPLELFHEDAP